MPYAETGGRLEDLQPRACEQLYRAMVKTCAVDTHRNALSVAKTLGEWCVKQGWIATNPLAEITDEGRLLWIEFGKTRRSRRTLEVPALLRPYLLALAKGRAADAQLISRTVSRRSGKKRDRYWLAHHVERLCAESKVPVVCTQSLRGLHASVATDAGATSHVVASALGHSSPAVTHAHYIDGATARRARTRRVVGKV
ncbi:MAG TPA: hypothetical protein VF516_47350, partial [Kofleriaceae bacterium]